MPRKVEISHRTIIFTVAFIILLALLWQIRQIIVGLFVALILMTAINPAVDRMEKMKIPRIFGIILVYLLIMVVVFLAIAGIIPPLVDQTSTLITNAPKFIENFGLPNIDQRIIESQIQQLGSLPANLVKISVSIFANLVAIAALLVITFYLLLERKNLNRYLHTLFGGDGEKKAEKFIDEMEKKIGHWVRAQLTSMVIIGVMSYLGLRLLGIEFALPLALLAGIFEIVPNIGPVMASVPAIFAGLAISPLMALAVAALYFLIQQIEANFIYPQIVSREAGVNPLITILSLTIGFKLGGILGATLAVPFVLLIQIIASEVFASEKFKRL
ncbi:MAG: AI-2E family transporter [Candidatus Marinimicrobia bacterium]|nr:AI-2E family transporter [Candidatus Neomarinimicrobiota bacterium]